MSWLFFLFMLFLILVVPVILGALTGEVYWLGVCLILGALIMGFVELVELIEAIRMFG